MILVLVIGQSITGLGMQYSSINGTALKNTVTPTASQSSTHMPISINSDSQMDLYFSGNGTDGLSWTSAYVIENLIIVNNSIETGIFINHTTRYLIIRNCQLTTLLAGIHIKSSTHIRIENNTITDSAYSIYLEGTTESIVDSNIVRENKNGIILEDSHFNNITNNNCSLNLINGIHLAFSNNNTIFSNNASFNKYYGLYFYDSRNNTAKNNYFGGNGIKCILSQWKTNVDMVNYFESNTCNDEGKTTNPTIPGYGLELIPIMLLCTAAMVFYFIIKNKKIRIRK